MDNSSQNPYIPQESEKIRQQVYEHQSPLGKIVKISLIVTTVVALLIGIGLFFVIPRSVAVDQQAREKLANELQPPTQTLKRVAVDSDMGFKLTYDNNVYSSYAEVGDSTSGSEESTAVVSGQRYDNNELRIARAYNYVRIRPIESAESARTLATQPPKLEIFATVTQKDLDAAATNKENKDLTKLSLFIKLDSDKRLEKKVADDGTIVTIDVSNAVAANIGGVDYQRVRFTTTNENHRVANVKYDECYYTIQNDVPYSVCVTDVRPANVSAASLVEQVMDSLSFHAPEVTEATTQQESADKKAVYMLPTIRLAQATTTAEESDEESDAEVPGSDETAEMSPLQTVQPDYYNDAQGLKAIAKNQPSVVRIGMIYCADLVLKYESGETATSLTDACSGSVSTGTLISKDGYIATTGHAVRSNKKAVITGYINSGTNQDMMIDRLQRILDYLLKADLLMQSDADYMLRGAKLGDQEALAKIANIASVIPDDLITPIKEEYTYAVQPGDKAIVVNRTDTNKPSFAYSDSTIAAEHIASSYDAERAAQLKFTDAPSSSDVGLLKAKGSLEFQATPIAPKEDMKADDRLYTVGYSAYTDSSLTIAKIRNMPIVSASKVEQAYEKDGKKLIQTNLPVLPGSDGAPVLNTQGEMTGFATYGFAYCPGQQCFASGTVRSTNELTKLLNESNIKLAVDSKASNKWREGVDQYFNANYAASTSSFAQAGSLYPFNRWASPINQLSKSNQGNSSDTSLMNQLQGIMIVLLVILIVATIILAIAFVVHRQRISQLQVGHYGVPAGPPVPIVNPTTTSAMTPPQQPVPGVGQQLPPLQPSQQQPQVPTQAPGYSAQPQPPQAQPRPTQQNGPEDPFYK